MLLHELMDELLLEKMLAEGLVRVQYHPVLPLSILNYTEKAQFSRPWNEVTLQCRGLIVNHDTAEIVARPFPKFFNYGEDQTSQSFDDYRNATVVVTDKLDGSLGILYPDESDASGYGIATRGSFTSPQALMGRVLLRQYIGAGWSPAPDFTYLFEIIYPANRIVCDYGNMEDLVLLGTVHTHDGWSQGPFSDWPGPRAKQFAFDSFEEALYAPPRKGAEGLVVHFPDRDMRLKIKQADYVALHKIVTGLNERAVWALMKEGKTPAEICEPLPDEFHQWVDETFRVLESQWWEIWNQVESVYWTIVQELTLNQMTGRDFTPKEFTRKEFALKATGTQYAGLLFAKLDGKDYAPAIWDLIRPSYRQGPWQRGEDNA